MSVFKRIVFTGLLCAFFCTGVTAQYGPAVVSNESAGLTQVPEYPGGMKKFYSHISNNFRYPEIDSTFTARVYVSFVVEQDGAMSDIKILRDPGFGLGDEAVRVLGLVPEKWVAGEQNGRKVRASYTLPISLNFEEIPKKKKVIK